MGKYIDEAYNLLEEIAANNYQWHVDRLQSRKSVGVYELDTKTFIVAQLEALTNKMDASQANPSPVNAIQSPLIQSPYAQSPPLQSSFA